jgi:hypothetical protein
MNSRRSGGVATPVGIHSSGTLRPWRQGKAGRKRSVQPQEDGGRPEDGEKDSGLGADGRPEDVQIADRGKPQPIDQQVAHEPQQDQADRDNDGSDDERHHGASPPRPRSGSGDPNRHGLIRRYEMARPFRLYNWRIARLERTRGGGQ